VHFTYTTVNAVSGFWLRLRVNRPSGSISTPIAASRPSSILNPYVDVLADEKDGTLPSLARLELRNMSFRELYSPPYTTSDYAVIRSHTRRIYVAMRSLERGTAFNPYIYFTDNYRAEDNISASIIDASSSFGDDYSSATGRTLRVVNAPVTEDFVDRAKITIDADIANQYYGSYHVFLLNIHVYPGIENGYMYIRLKVNSGSGSEYKSTSFAATREYFSAVENPRGILDCGQITIPSSGMLAFGENANEITITIQSKTTYAYSSLYCGSVLLLPADEWIGAFEDRSDSYNGWLTPSTALALDSCGNPRVNTRALLTEYSGGAMRGLWQSITPGEIEIPANKDVRIWFWADQVDLWSRAKVEIAHVVQLHKVHRYLGSRGAI